MPNSLAELLDERLGRGRGYLTKADAVEALGVSPAAFNAAAARLVKQRQLARPRQGFFVILRPEDRASGGPDPARWIDPLMRHLGIDYRVSLLRAAAFHGSSHQAAQAFQVVTPKQLRPVAVDRQRVEFLYQAPAAFARVNTAPWLDDLKSDAGFAQVAGVELLLLDAVRYFHQTAGLNGAAQIVHDLGGRAHPRKLEARGRGVRELRRASSRVPARALRPHAAGRQAAAAGGAGQVVEAARPVGARRPQPGRQRGPRGGRDLEAPAERPRGDRRMIPRAHIQAWSATTPWREPRQVEQDLIICRALCDIFSEPFLAERLAFRGGTAIHKLLFRQPLRYSEDIDLVQRRAEPIGPTVNALRDVLSWLGPFQRDTAAHSLHLNYRFIPESEPTVRAKVKVEINTREHEYF